MMSCFLDIAVTNRNHELEKEKGEEKNSRTVPKTWERTRTLSYRSLALIKDSSPKNWESTNGSHDTPHKIAIIVKEGRQVRLHLCPSEEHCTGRSSA